MNYNLNPKKPNEICQGVYDFPRERAVIEMHGKEVGCKFLNEGYCTNFQPLHPNKGFKKCKKLDLLEEDRSELDIL